MKAAADRCAANWIDKREVVQQIKDWEDLIKEAGATVEAWKKLEHENDNGCNSERSGSPLSGIETPTNGRATRSGNNLKRKEYEDNLFKRVAEMNQKAKRTRDLRRSS